MKRKSVICYILTALMCISLLSNFPARANVASADEYDDGMDDPDADAGAADDAADSDQSTQAAADESMVLHLQFDGNLTDTSGKSNNAACNTGSITYDTGIFGQCAVFNGKSYLEVADSDSLDLKESFTISFWAYKEDMKDNDYVPFIYKEEDEESWATPYNVYEHWKNAPGLYLHDGGAGTELNQYLIDGGIMDIRKWFLFTATYDGDEIKIYYNGVVVKKNSVTGSLAATVNDLYIGMMNSLDVTYFLKGKMDDLRIYNYALTGSAVDGLYDDGFKSNPGFLSQKDSLVAYYKFENNFKDSTSFGNDAEKITGEGSLSFVNAVCGKGLKFSKGGYLEVEDNDSINFDKEFTMTGWICVNKSDVALPILNRVGASTSDISNDFSYRVEAYDDALNFYYSPFVDGYDFEGTSYSLSSSMKNKWYHIAVTFDGKQVRWYKNGTMVNKEEIEGMEIAHAAGSLMIGSTGEDFMEGSLDELKLYNYALSADEVKKDAGRKDSLSISTDNQNKIKTLKVKDTVTVKTSRTYIDTKKTSVLTSGVTYKSSNSKVFTVSKEGKITAVKRGSAKLTVTHGGISKTYTVTVK